MRMLRFLVLFMAGWFLGHFCSATAQTGQLNSSGRIQSLRNKLSGQQRLGTSPGAVVKAMYQADLSGKLFTPDCAGLYKFFSKDTADSYADEIKKETFDYDPMLDAQNVDLKNLHITEDQVDGMRAKVTASFENFGVKKKKVFRLVQKDKAWKVLSID